MSSDLLFPDGTVTRFFFNTPFFSLDTLLPGRALIFITDRNIKKLYPGLFPPSRTVVLPPGEPHKNRRTVNYIYKSLLEMNIDRSATLVGVGGGSVTDLTGFTAATFHRGLTFGFVPTTLLASVDAAIGGKNGYNMGKIKNCIGTVRQPGFILWDFSFFSTLPEREWISGFAEIIKHGAISSSSHLDFLEQHTSDHFKHDKLLLARLVSESVRIKSDYVIKDQHEGGMRKLLNFGHTLGHALEHSCKLTHGEAVSRGMVYALRLSEKFSSLNHEEALRLEALLKHYRLPTAMDFKPGSVFKILAKDKKKRGELIDFVLLDTLGQASLHPISLEKVRKDLYDLCCHRP
jgi:3-dehydroquinate synthase